MIKTTTATVDVASRTFFLGGRRTLPTLKNGWTCESDASVFLQLDFFLSSKKCILKIWIWHRPQFLESVKKHHNSRGTQIPESFFVGSWYFKTPTGQGQNPRHPGPPGWGYKKTCQLLYFEWSPPWHVGWRLSGEGCHWEYDGKNGEFENIDFRFPWLSDTSEMGFGHDVPFLNYSDRLPHPSDLCQPDRVRWG